MSIPPRSLPGRCRGRSRAMSQVATATPARASGPGIPRPRRTLALAGIAHALHDGLTDLIYVLLPVWQADSGSATGRSRLLRGLYVGALAALQVPVGRLAAPPERPACPGPRHSLIAGGYALAGFSGGLARPGCLPLLAARCGQHPAPARVRGRLARLWRAGPRPARHLQFRGRPRQGRAPAGRRPAADGHGLAQVALGLAGLGVVAAVPARVADAAGSDLCPRPGPPTSTARGAGGKGGFRLLLAIGVLDSARADGLPAFCPSSCRPRARP